MNAEITQWAIRNGVSLHALTELSMIFGFGVPSYTVNPAHSMIAGTESYVQSQVRLEAAHKGLKLWRNNVGVLMNERGTPVRYGLGNDSSSLNKAIKSGDLIGWRPVVIAGVKIAQFVSRECKRPDWQYTATDHELAQLKWAEVVNADGGDAKFVTGEGSL